MNTVPDDRDPIDGLYVSIFGSVGSLTERETTQIKCKRLESVFCRLHPGHSEQF